MYQRYSQLRSAVRKGLRQLCRICTVRPSDQFSAKNKVSNAPNVWVSNGIEPQKTLVQGIRHTFMVPFWYGQSKEVGAV